jgi:hypothetical protein
MSLTREELQELHELASAAVDGRLDEAARERLQRRLLESEEARRFYVGYMGMSAELALAAADAAAARTIRVPARVVRAPRPAAILVRPPAPTMLRWWPALAAAACAVALAGTMLHRHLRGGTRGEAVTAFAKAVSSERGVARLTHAAGARLAHAAGGGLDLGSSISAGRLRLSSGVMEVEFASGARVVLESPAEFVVLSGNEGLLRHGRMSAHVPPAARGFRLWTSDMVVTDLGTAFGVSLLPDRAPEVHVFEGKVELTRSGAAEPPSGLTAGRAARVEPARVRELAADPGAFVREEEVARREAAELRTRYDAWKQACRAFDTDPDLRVHFDFERRAGADAALLNSALASDPRTQGVVSGCATTRGRWPDKGALEFKGKGDRVRLNVPGAYTSLTYLAWVRVDGLPNHFNGLCLTDWSAAGEVHWQVTNAGEIEFSVRDPKSGAGWGQLLSPSVFSKERLRRWLHLAAVYDGPGRSMSLYVNGERVASQAIEQSRVLLLGAMELGNWTREAGSSRQSNRALSGAMDEFALLARPLSGGEIRVLYEVGRPRPPLVAEAAAAPGAVP